MAGEQPVPRVTGRRITRENRYFRTIEEDLPDRHGQPYTYHFCESLWDAVLVIPLLDDGRLIVERIYRHPYHAWMWEFPAGGIEIGEAPLRAAARELEEETGWRPNRLDDLGPIEAIPGLVRMRLHLVLARNLTHVGGIRHEAMEHIQVAQMTIDEAWNAAASTTEPVSSFLALGLGRLERWRNRG